MCVHVRARSVCMSERQEGQACAQVCPVAALKDPQEHKPGAPECAQSVWTRQTKAESKLFAQPLRARTPGTVLSQSTVSTLSLSKTLSGAAQEPAQGGHGSRDKQVARAVQM